MATASSSTPAVSFANASEGEGDGFDCVLEDAGFFAGPLSSKSIDAQEALNQLGLQPSPPRSRPFMDDGDDVPFDLDRELEAEEEQDDGGQQWEEEDFSDVQAGAEDAEGVGPSPLKPTSSQPHNQSTAAEAAAIAAMEELARECMGASTSTNHLAAIPQIVPEDDAEGGEELGMSGLPKYIAAGTGTATLLDGSTIRFEKKRRMKGWKPKSAHYGIGSTGLLSQPVHQIVDRIQARAAVRVAEDSEHKHRMPKAPRETRELWQERYRPQRFTELVGEERTHRDVMRWLKEWDACVFGKKAHLRKKWKSSGEEAEGPVYSDKWSRPRERILLLGGPAGMGKTTLAHVAAKQCGYLVHELNASDDRSARTVEDRVRDALESKSLRQETNLPTCLVLDEVDGATGGRGEEGGGFIKALIKLVERGNGTSKAKKGGKKLRPLLRPIVCICNDPYSPNLRALRPYSKLIRLSRPSTALLTRRLKHICEGEKIAADAKGLITLIDVCQGDIRSCLNVLQLIQSDHAGLTADTFKQGGDDSVKEDRLASALGIKDGNASIHQVWSQLFQTLTTKEKAQKRGGNAEGNGDCDRGSEVVGSIINSGDMDKILAGCFEHYPTLKLVDDGWWRYKKMHDWIYWFEHLNKTSWQVGAQTEMWSYLPWSFVGWRYMFASTGNELPSYPRTDYQNHLRRTAFDEVTADFISCLPAPLRSQFNALSTVTELGPSLVTLLSPDLKLINSQLVRPEERSTLTSVVNIMQHCNLNFVMDKNEQAQSYYRFEPPLEAFVQFEGKKSLSVGPAKFQLRQMITSELQTARVKARRVEMGKDANESSRAQDAQGYKDAYARGINGSAQQKAAAPKTRIPVDFFGRPIVPKIIASAPVSLPDSILGRRKENEGEGEVAPCDVKRAKLKVFYNYHEGYSNAVRKPVKMSSLLL